MLGAYWFGDDSGFDRLVLKFVGANADELVEAVGKCDGDDAVWTWLGDRVTGKDPAEIEAFNRTIWTVSPRVTINEHLCVKRSVRSIRVGRT